MPESLVFPGMLGCQRCGLAEGRIRVVPGFGPTDAKVMLVAQSPGDTEALKGRPLIGVSGQLLARYCSIIGWDLDKDIYRTNVNKCHPPKNRVCSRSEITACKPWLEQEIATVDPLIIIACGDTAYKSFLPDETSKITQIRGNVYTRVIGGKRRYVIPTVHPAAVGRNELAYGKLFLGDLRKAKAIADSGTYEVPASTFRKTRADWDEILDAVSSCSEFGFDLETDTGSADDPSDEDDDQGMRRAGIVGLGLCTQPGDGLYYSFEDDDEAYTKTRELRRWLEDPRLPTIVSNAKFERHILRGYGIELQGWEDTMLLAWIAGDFPLGLKDGFHRAFGIEMQKIDLFKKLGFTKKHPVTGKVMPDMRAATSENPWKVAEYAAQDPDASLRLYRYLVPIIKERKLWDIYEHIEKPFTDVIMAMEENGFLFDPNALTIARAMVIAQRYESEQYLYNMNGGEMNLNSVPQKVALLYHGKHPYRIPPIQERDGSLSYPTDRVQLARYNTNPVVRALLTYNAMDKLMGTYINKLPLWMDKSGRIHAEFRQTGAETGRISSTNPNITNIPSRKREDIDGGVDGSHIRYGFIAPPGFKICAVDLSQIEMRIAAHLSGDPDMIRELGPGGDIHSHSTRKIFKITEDSVDKREWKNKRDLAKMINFGTLYRLTGHGLVLRAPSANLSQDEAEEFIRELYATYPLFGQWQEDTIAFTRKHGYAQTITGRRRYFPEITNKIPSRRAEAERGCINHPIQGSAADFFKVAILNVKAFLEAHPEESAGVRMIAQVHDELVLEAPDEAIPWLAEHTPKLMASAFELRVPVFTDFEYGQNWGDVHKYDPAIGVV